MMTNLDIEAIKATEVIKQYCTDIDCADCIFNYCGDCILYGSGNYNYNYVPYNWHIDLIKGE